MCASDTSVTSRKIICGRLKLLSAKAPASNPNSEAESHESGLSRLSLSKSMSGGFRVPFKIAPNEAYEGP